jgi:hypothetical protein
MGKKGEKNVKAPVTNRILGKPLDNTPPTQEQYNRFYALAKRIFEAAPWEYLEECQVLAVERNADETDFVSVMGAIQQHYAVAVYPSLVCLDRVMSISECSGQEARDIMFDIPQM